MNTTVIQKSDAKGILRNEKGLTLIELLAVIVILAIIAAIAIPSIGGIINKTKRESHRANAQMIVDAARYKVSVEDFKPDASSPTTETITLQTLKDDGFLGNIPQDPQGSGTYNATSTVVTVNHDSSTGNNTFAITLVGAKTYFSNVSEEDIKDAEIAPSPSPSPSTP